MPVPSPRGRRKDASPGCPPYKRRVAADHPGCGEKSTRGTETITISAKEESGKTKNHHYQVCSLSVGYWIEEGCRQPAYKRPNRRDRVPEN